MVGTLHVWQDETHLEEKMKDFKRLATLLVVTPPISQKDGRLRQGALEGPIVEEHQGATVGIN